MSSKCTAAKAYDILGIYDFPDNFDALNGLHSYLYTNSDMVVEALASQKYDLARDIVTAIETVDKDGSYDDCAFYVSRDGIRILRTAEELIDALGDENGKTASTLLAKNGINVYAEGFQEIGSLFGREGAGVGFAKQTDGESFTYAFAWPEGDAWATLTGYLNFDEQPEEYVRRVLQDGGFRSDWDNPDYDPIGDFKETAGDEYRIPLLKVSSPAEIYRKAGFPKSPFFYTYNHLRDALVPKGFYPSNVHVKHPHGLTLEQIKRLPELLERPVVLMDSDRDDTMVAVLADVDGDGLPLIAALRPGANAVSGGRCVPGTIVCSVYGKPESYFLHKMQQMPQRVLYQDIEKGRELDARAKLQLFGGNIASPDLDRKIIRLPECIVKLQAGSAPTEATRVQQESRDMASGSHALGAARPAFGTPAMNRPIDSNLE